MISARLSYLAPRLRWIRVGRRATWSAATGAASLARVSFAAVLVVAGIFAAYDLLQVRDVLTPGSLGIDLHTYEAATRNWLAGDGFYNARQLSGPYAVSGASTAYIGDILYPPTALPLFLGALVLPDFVWWLIPLGLLAWFVWECRPGRLGWALVAVCALFPGSFHSVVAGNPAMWVAAAAASGLRFGWPAVLVLVKPTLVPFALIGIRRHSWWLAAAALAAATLFLWPMTVQWLHAALDARGTGGLLYSLKEFPLAMLPLGAWLARASAKRTVASEAANPMRLTCDTATMATGFAAHRPPPRSLEGRSRRSVESQRGAARHDPGPGSGPVATIPHGGAAKPQPGATW